MSGRKRLPEAVTGSGVLRSGLLLVGMATDGGSLPRMARSVVPSKLWSPFKELVGTVNAALVSKHPDAIGDLEVALRKHKANFISLLKNPPKNAAEREAVRKASTVPLQLPSGTSTLLDAAAINEALILSDLFDISEYDAVELLLTGERQLAYFTGLTRGLVAVVLYYDGRRCLVAALRMLIQSREGRLWSTDVGSEASAVVMDFTQKLMEHNLVSQILSQIASLNTVSELEQLRKQRAIGDPHHRQQVVDLMKETHQGLADCIYCWAAQNPLSVSDTLAVINHLRCVDVSVNPDGTLDNVTLTLLMALLYCFDTTCLEECEDTDPFVKSLPYVDDAAYVADVHKAIYGDRAGAWKSLGIQSCLQFAWAMLLQVLSRHPSVQEDAIETCDEADSVADAAIAGDIFQFLKNAVVSSSMFAQEPYYMRRIHGLITTFIYHMPLKVKELRNRSDESARLIMAQQYERIDHTPASVPRRDFQHLLLLIGEVYKIEGNTYHLAEEYWCFGTDRMTSVQCSQKQVSLFKFVKMAGDLISPPLYVPYITMLTGLASGEACSSSCFGLLKLNGEVSSIVSWDHMFNSLDKYYKDLRHKIMPEAHGRPHYKRDITAQEQDGLIAVLKLVKQVAQYNAAVRTAMVENQQWLPMVVLLGLVTCSVPAVLKAQILSTLAAFAKSRDIAATMWHALEHTQVLPTVPGARLGGINTELEDVESRNEEYPITRAFLNLLDALIEAVPPPESLGVGYRVPGFDPYLNFIVNDVLMKCNSRGYKDASEKWGLAEAALSAVHRLLATYDVQFDHAPDRTIEVSLPSGPATAVASKPAGFSLLACLMQQSGGLLRTLLTFIHSGLEQLCAYTIFTGKQAMDRSILLSLKIINCALDKQVPLREAVIRAGQQSNLVLLPMDKLLGGINQKSGKADHLVNIARFVCYNQQLPEHALQSVRLLGSLAGTTSLPADFVTVLTADEAVRNEILMGFVECIETISDVCGVSPSVEAGADECTDEQQLRFSIAVEVVNLLLAAVDSTAPGFSYFLLGFDTKRRTSKSELQPAGMLSTARTCLHAIVYLLDFALPCDGKPQQGNVMGFVSPLITLAYQLVYKLCLNAGGAAEPTLRYLRTGHDFFCQHVRQVLSSTHRTGESLKQMTWLLKCVAIELRVLSAGQQHSQLQRLVASLLGDTDEGSAGDTLPGSDGPLMDQGELSPRRMAGLGSSFSVLPSTTAYSGRGSSGQQSRLLSALGRIDFSDPGLPELHLEQFVPAAVQQVILSCEDQASSMADDADAGNLVLCDVVRLHQILEQELCGSQASFTPIQREPLEREVTNILEYAVQRNSRKTQIFFKKESFNAWRQVLEVLLTSCFEIVSATRRQSMLLEILTELLRRVHQDSDDALPELVSPVAGVVLMVTASLQQSLAAPFPKTQVGVESGTRWRELYRIGRGPLALRAGVVSSLQVVLQGLLSFMTSSSTSITQRAKANLYGALLYYLRIGTRPEQARLDLGGTAMHVEDAIELRDAVLEKLESESLSTINSFGDTLLDNICRSACDGHNIGRMLALAVLDAILRLDKYHQCLTFMLSKGYLKHIVDSLKIDDGALQDALVPGAEQPRALYIYESKMALLCRVSETAHGAAALLQSGLLTALCECSVYDLRPFDDHRMTLGKVQAMDYDGAVPNATARYRQVLFPCLRICLAILTSLGADNVEAANQVMRLVVSHGETFYGILRDRRAGLLPASIADLEELMLVTAVLCRSALAETLEESLAKDASSAVSEHALQVRGQLARVQRQMLTLLPVFCCGGSSMMAAAVCRLISSTTGDGSQSMTEEATVYVQEISTNIIGYCRSVVSKSAPNARFCRVVFSPSLAGAVEAADRVTAGLDSGAAQAADSLRGGAWARVRPPALGLIVAELRSSATRLLESLDDREKLLARADSVAELSLDRLKEISGTAGIEKMHVDDRIALARQAIQKQAARKVHEIHLLLFNVESSLFLLWRHLEFFLVHCVPQDAEDSLFWSTKRSATTVRKLTSGSRTADTASQSPALAEGRLTAGGPSDMSSQGVSQLELEQLRKQAPACIDDTLLRQLKDIEQCYAGKQSRYGFIAALLGRVQRLLHLHC